MRTRGGCRRSRFRMQGSCERLLPLLPLSSPGLTGRSSTPRLLDSITCVSGILGHPPSRVTTTEHDLAFPRRDAPELYCYFGPHKNRGRREGRVLARTRGLVCKECAKIRTRAYRCSRGIPAFPAQWFYDLFRALPGDEFVLLRSGWIKRISADLTPATGARTTRLCRTR